MIIDGKAIAHEIYEKIQKEVLALHRAPRLSIITCAPNFETQKYLKLKEKRATEVGIQTKVVTIQETMTTEELIHLVMSESKDSEGVIVQLPLPSSIDTERVIATIPVTHDVDALNLKTTTVVSPVVGACIEILKKYKIGVFQKHVTIIGGGKLVGLPAYHWFIAQGAYVSIVTKDTEDIAHYTKHADVIVCGAGFPGLLTPDMVQEDVIILDAGTSEEGGVLRGDAHTDCAKKAKIFTPVPGGIGPITIAVLLQNLIVLMRA